MVMVGSGGSGRVGSMACGSDLGAAEGGGSGCEGGGDGFGSAGGIGEMGAHAFVGGFGAGDLGELDEEEHCDPD